MSDAPASPGDSRQRLVGVWVVPHVDKVHDAIPEAKASDSTESARQCGGCCTHRVAAATPGASLHAKNSRHGSLTPTIAWRLQVAEHRDCRSPAQHGFDLRWHQIVRQAAHPQLRRWELVHVGRFGCTARRAEHRKSGRTDGRRRRQRRRHRCNLKRRLAATPASALGRLFECSRQRPATIGEAQALEGWRALALAA